MFGLTYFVFDFGVVRKVWIVLIAIGHLSVSVPLQYLVHAAIVTRFSLVFLPVLFMAFSTLLNVSILIAFYGWAIELDRPARTQGTQPGNGQPRPGTAYGSRIRDQGSRSSNHRSRLEDQAIRGPAPGALTRSSAALAEWPRRASLSDQ